MGYYPHVKTLAFFILFLSTSQASASLGEKLLPSSLPDGLCKITLEKEFDNQSFHCTGSYLGNGHVKTAGHCLHKAKVKYLNCKGSDKTFYVEEEKVFPSYDHLLLNREEFNRWRDHALLKLKTLPNIPAFVHVSSKERFHELQQKFSVCLISGYGINEANPGATGFLHGSSFSPKILSLKNELLYVEGDYRVELMPGDSGGPLLCRFEQTWYDLGTASAHNWQHDSLFAPNFAAKDWFNLFPTNQFHLNQYPELQKEFVIAAELTIGHTYYLLPYSEVSSDEGSFFNGDNSFTKITVTKIERERVYGIVESLGSSSFFMCEDDFLCYGKVVEGVVSKDRILEKRYLFKK